MKNNTDLLRLIQETLVKDTNLRDCLDNIYILVNDGSVIIAGSVTQRALKTLARKTISGIPGVNILIDDLKIEPIRQQRVGVKIDWARGHMSVV